jgi:putative protein kinase ArgK-like GTPase of G3E family
MTNPKNEWHGGNYNDAFWSGFWKGAQVGQTIVAVNNIIEGFCEVTRTADGVGAATQPDLKQKMETSEINVIDKIDVKNNVADKYVPWETRMQDSLIYPDKESMVADMARYLGDNSITINDGYRTFPEQFADYMNPFLDAVNPFTSVSQHQLYRAFDVIFERPHTKEQIIYAALCAGFKGIGYSNNGTWAHVDLWMRREWSYGY